MASVRCQDEALGYTIAASVPATDIPTNGVLIRNILHAADTVMSHILHLYHLSAADFLDFNAGVGPFDAMSPWIPSYAGGDLIDASTGLGATLVGHYVQALEIRRKAHVLCSIWNAKNPCGASPVAGGATEIATTAKINDSKALINEIRTFINTTYIPDVLTVAGAYSQYWNVSQGCLNLLSYGDFPDAQTGTLLIKRGRAAVLSLDTVDQTRIREYVGYSFYKDADDAKHPSVGVTRPDLAKKTAGVAYSWLKAPRYLATGGEAKPGGGFYTVNEPIAMEVGPLARMVVTHLSGATETVTEADMPVGTSLGEAAGGSNLGPYTVSALITTALGLAGVTADKLYSPLGRHAARALECKVLADAIGGTSGGVTSWLDQLQANVTGPSYLHRNIPVSGSGAGLVEAPRGALGHWINIAGKKIFNYQCVVPSTWNFSPRDTAGNKGPVEWALQGQTVGTDNQTAILNILRIVHPFDCCIACAVHVVSPDGKELARCKFDTAGKMTEFIVNE